jgi:hypothetical protein
LNLPSSGLHLTRLHRRLVRRVARHRFAADWTIDFGTGIGCIVSPQVLFKQSAGQSIAQLTGPVFAFCKSDQTVLAIAAEHPIEYSARLFLKLPTSSPKLFTIDSRHGRSSLIGCAIGEYGNPLPPPLLLSRQRNTTTVVHPMQEPK